MKLKAFLLKEFSGWGKYERIIFPLEILLIIIISFAIKDDKIALISAVCGISYTIFAGKGKISCYFFGILATICYSYISFKNHLLGNCFLNLFCYLPLQVLGIYNWRKNLKKDTNEVKKTRLSSKNRAIYLIISLVSIIVVYNLLKSYSDSSPFYDAATTVFSVFGLILTVRRCAEQWYLWFFVNLFSTIMWIQAYLQGSNCFATIIMWVTYLALSVYFLHTWNRELSQNYNN